MYHDVVEPGAPDASGFPGRGAGLYKLTRQEFREHLDAIAAARIGVSTTDRRGEWSGRDLLFTFDDGGLTFFDPIAPMLEERGWRGHFFITTSRIGTPGFLTAGQVLDLHRRGHVIGSHSVTHPTRMAACSVEQLRREWRESVDALESLVGQRVAVASVPGGYYSQAVGTTAAEAGIEVLFNSEPESRAHQLGNTMVLGRYAVQTGMSAAECVGLATESFLPVFRQRSLWTAKKLAKAVAGPVYLRVQKLLLER